MSESTAADREERTVEQVRDREVGCETDDGLIQTHPESEWCDVCGPRRIEELERERDEARETLGRNLDAFQKDLGAMLRALGLGDHARTVSPHAVVTDEVLPRLSAYRALAERAKGLDLERVADLGSGGFRHLDLEDIKLIREAADVLRGFAQEQEAAG